MNLIFAAARYYPFWTLPLIFIVIELGIYFKRNKSKLFYAMILWLVFIVITNICWVAFKGYQNSDAWIKHALGVSGVQESPE